LDKKRKAVIARVPCPLFSRSDHTRNSQKRPKLMKRKRVKALIKSIQKTSLSGVLTNKPVYLGVISMLNAARRQTKILFRGPASQR